MKNSAFDWDNVTGFNFTFALVGGAWLRDGHGKMNWMSFEKIDKELGEEWRNRQLKAQGEFTGCWIEVVPVEAHKCLFYKFSETGPATCTYCGVAEIV